MKVVKRVYFCAITIDHKAVAFAIYSDKSYPEDNEIYLLPIDAARILGYYHDSKEQADEMIEKDLAPLFNLTSIITERIGHNKWDYDIVEADIEMNMDFENQETRKIKEQVILIP